MVPTPVKRPVILYPDPVLRQKAKPVGRVDDQIRELVQDMFETMKAEEGAGLAAPQVGISLRLFVTGSQDRAVPHKAYINPVLVDLQGDLEPVDEGCLSLPEIRGVVRRPIQCTIRATDLDGNEFTETSSDFAARVWQHEYDHLDGILIIDKMSPIDRLRVRRALKDLKAAWQK
jgi:peptide deformylase